MAFCTEEKRANRKRIWFKRQRQLLYGCQWPSIYETVPTISNMDKLSNLNQTKCFNFFSSTSVILFLKSNMIHIRWSERFKRDRKMTNCKRASGKEKPLASVH